MKAKRILRTVALAALAAFIGLTVFLWNASTLVGDRLPMPWGQGVAVVLSGSMEPELSVDDLIFVARQDTYRERDVVVYQSGQSLVVHRIIAMEDGSVTTQGDANNAPDQPIPLESIRGKVVFAVPYVGTVVRFLKSPLGFTLVLALALWLLGRSYAKEKAADEADLDRIRQEIRKLKEED